MEGLGRGMVLGWGVVGRAGGVGVCWWCAFIHNYVHIIEVEYHMSHQTRKQGIGVEFVTRGHDIIIRCDKTTTKTIYVDLDTEKNTSLLLDRNGRHVIVEKECEELKRNNEKNGASYIHGK